MATRTKKIKRKALVPGMGRIGFRIVLLLLFFSGSKTLLAQEEEIPKPELSKRVLFVALSPFALIDIVEGASVRLGAETKVYKNVALWVETMFYTSIGNVYAHAEDPRGFGIKPGLKFYLNKQGLVDGDYIGIEYLRKHISYHLYDSIALRTVPTYFTEYSVSKYATCFSIKYGHVEGHKRFVYEWFCGAGIRFVDAASTLTKEEYNGIVRDEDLRNNTGGGYAVRQLGHMIYPNLVIGLKLGYRIK